MRPLQLAIVLAVGLASVSQLRASACGTNPLSAYDVPGFTCQLGPFTMTDFVYTKLGGTLTIPDTAITVTPSIGIDSLELTFSSTQFSATGSDSALYLLAYTWDPAPIRGAEDILADPVIFPGLVQITTDICRDAPFSGAICPTSIATLQVSDNGITAILTDSTTFSPTISVAGVRNTIEIDGNGVSASFDSFSNEVFIPEPGTSMGGLFALALAIGSLRLKRR